LQSAERRQERIEELPRRLLQGLLEQRHRSPAEPGASAPAVRPTRSAPVGDPPISRHFRARRSARVWMEMEPALYWSCIGIDPSAKSFKPDWLETHRQGPLQLRGAGSKLAEKRELGLAPLRGGWPETLKASCVSRRPRSELGETSRPRSEPRRPVVVLGQVGLDRQGEESLHVLGIGSVFRRRDSPPAAAVPP